jgi:hypothetical protein
MTWNFSMIAPFCSDALFTSENIASAPVREVNQPFQLTRKAKVSALLPDLALGNHVDLLHNRARLDDALPAGKHLGFALVREVNHVPGRQLVERRGLTQDLQSVERCIRIFRFLSKCAVKIL